MVVKSVAAKSRIISLALFGSTIFFGSIASGQPDSPPAALTPDQQRQIDKANELNAQFLKLSDQSKFKEAIPIGIQVLEIRQKIRGENNRDTANTLNLLGHALINVSDFAAAKPYLDRALATRKKLLGVDHADTGTTLNNLGILYYRKADFAAAKPFFEETLEIRRINPDEDNPQTISSLMNMGLVLQALADFKGARIYFETALASRKKVFGDEHPNTLTALSYLASLLQSQGDLKGAQPYLEQILAIRKKVNGEENAETALALNNMGLLLVYQADYATARIYLEQALAIRQKVLGENHVETTTSLNNLGVLFSNKGDYATATKYYEQALAIRQKTLGPEHLYTALSLNNLGLLLQAQGDFNAALPYYEQALAIRKKVLTENHRDTATSMVSLGRLLSEQGNPAAARKQFEQALAIRKKILGDNHPDTAQCLSLMGMLLSAQGDQEGARPLLNQAFEINRKARGDQHPDTAQAIHNLGRLFSAMNDYATARTFLEQALVIRRKALGLEHRMTAQSLNALGIVQTAQEDYSNARTNFEEALKINKAVCGEEHPETTATLNNLGVLFIKQKEYTTARGFVVQALKIQKKNMGEEHPTIAKYSHNLAVLESDLGNWVTAASLADQSRRATRRNIARLFPSLSIKEQLSYLDQNDKPLFHTSLSLGLARNQDPSITALSAGWLLNGKGVAQEAIAVSVLLARDEQDPALVTIAKQLIELRRQLSSLSLSSPPVGQEQSRQVKLEQLTREEERLSRQIAQANGRNSGVTSWVEPYLLRQTLPADAVLIDIARINVRNFQSKNQKDLWLPPHYVAWIVPAADKGEVQVVDLGAADVIESAIEKVRQGIAAAGQTDSTLRTEGEIAAEKQTRDDLQQAADLVWKPLADKIGTPKRLILSPDGALWLLPWAALPVAKDKCLLEEYPLHYVTNARDIVNPQTSRRTTSKPALFADPDFNLTLEKNPQNTQTESPNSKVEKKETAEDESTTRSALPQVGRLPNTAVEAKAITPNIARFAKAEPQLFAEAFALESTVKQVQRPALLVLSTHGFFLPDQETKANDTLLVSSETRATNMASNDKSFENPLLRCGLLLAGCNSRRTADADDGILTGMEIIGIDLRGTELVVLSACETGIGKVHNGEGVAGLRQAFQLAGAKSVVATLWQVPDRDSSIIMSDFFSNLADGQNKQDALRNAQIKRIEARREKNGAAHPFFWAAWTLTGE